jgi:hypothetical protein
VTRSSIPARSVRTAVGLRGGDDLVAGLERGEQSGGNSGHAGRSDNRGLCTLKSCNFLLRDSECGIAITSVDVGLVFPLGPQLHFFGGRKCERGRADNLRYDGAVNATAVGFTGMNGFCLRSKLVLGFVFHGEECAP